MKKIGVARLREGDIVVLKSSRLLGGQDGAEKLKEKLQAKFPGYTCMVLGADLEFSIIHPVKPYEADSL